MKKISLICALWFLLASPKAHNIYYVSTTGNDQNAGTSPAAAWRTITHALASASPVEAGDIVYVQAGLYAGEHILVEKSGTANHPLVIQGYRQVPGDDPGFAFDYGDTPDASRMPLLDGGDRSQGIGIDLNGAQYVQWHNFQITRYAYGIMDHSHLADRHVLLDHIYLTVFGDTSDDYSGKAVELISSDNTIRRCLVVNASAQGIYVEGDRNLIEDCKVYCDDTTSDRAAMDYYIVVYFGNHNTVRNCYTERIGDLPHYGHGIGVKGDAQYNSFENCTAVNFRDEAFYVRHRGAQHNTFRHCHARGVTEDATGFIVRDGASYNTFDACTVSDCKRGIMFEDSSEDGGAQYCGRYNVFRNCILTNNETGIDFNDYEEDTDVDGNSFYNCVFQGGTTLINVERNNYNNQMVNCVVSGYQQLKTESNGYTLYFDFSYSDFFNNGFSSPSGTGNHAADPQFIDTANHDFHLRPGSPCIDTGTANGAPVTDFDGNPRPAGSAPDIGAYEYRP